MILLDTSVLIDALTGPRRSASVLRRAIEGGDRVALPTLVVNEWQRGPRARRRPARRGAQGPVSAAGLFATRTELQELHEEPQVPNYGKAKRGLKLVPGLTAA